METNNLDLITLIQKVPTATVSLQLSDLNTFSRRLIAQTREEYEREITGRLEARNEVSASIECKYGIKGTLNYCGVIKDTPLSLFTLTVGSLRHIIVATPDGEAFRYPHVPALGAKGMERVASNAVHGTYDSGKGLNVHISNIARIAQILYPDNDRVRGNSWSGKAALSEEQRQQLRELERSGAANASFEDTTYVEFLG